jgi:hypothetical protein
MLRMNSSPAEFEVNTTCFFCFDDPSVAPEPVRHVTFKSAKSEEGFICGPHLNRAEALDQLTEIRLVTTGIQRVREAAEADLLEFDLYTASLEE